MRQTDGEKEFAYSIKTIYVCGIKSWLRYNKYVIGFMCASARSSITLDYYNITVN